MARIKFKHVVRLLVLGFATILVVGFAYLKTRNISEELVITILEPENGSTITENPLRLVGSIPNAASIEVSGIKVLPDSEGGFSRELLLAPGYNVIAIQAEDRFERKALTKLEIVYKPKEEQTHEKEGEGSQTTSGESGEE